MWISEIPNGLSLPPTHRCVSMTSGDITLQFVWNLAPTRPVYLKLALTLKYVFNHWEILFVPWSKHVPIMWLDGHESPQHELYQGHTPTYTHCWLEVGILSWRCAKWQQQYYHLKDALLALLMVRTQWLLKHLMHHWRIVPFGFMPLCSFHACETERQRHPVSCSCGLLQTSRWEQ